MTSFIVYFQAAKLCGLYVSARIDIQRKNVVLKLINEHFTHADVGKYVGVSRSRITRFLKRYRRRKSVENLHRSGRPATTSLRDGRHILRVVKSNRKRSLGKITGIVNNDLSTSLLADNSSSFTHMWLSQTQNTEDIDDCKTQPCATSVLV